MRHRAVLQAQRTRRNLNQQAIHRAHRRCDLLRTAADDSSAVLPSSAIHEEEPRNPQTAMPPPS